MDFDGASLLSSIVVSSVGFISFYYGRKMKRLPQIVIGLAMMVFPYFVPGALLTIVVGAALAGLLWVALYFEL